MDTHNLTIDERPPLGLAKAAHRLGVSQTTLRRLVRRREIEAIRIGGQWRFEPQALNEFLAVNRVPISIDSSESTEPCD